jgi:hypothetical protein
VIAIRCGGTSVDDWIENPRALVTAVQLLHEIDLRRR